MVQAEGTLSHIRFQTHWYKNTQRLKQYAKWAFKLEIPTDYWVIISTRIDPKGSRKYDPKVYRVLERSNPDAKAWFEYIN
jgi:hypothetical protein